MGKRNSIVILLNNDITINNISLIDNYNARKEIQVSQKVGLLNMQKNNSGNIIFPTQPRNS